jgi:hypothetical protein
MTSWPDALGLKRHAFLRRPLPCFEKREPGNSGWPTISPSTIPSFASAGSPGQKRKAPLGAFPSPASCEVPARPPPHTRTAPAGEMAVGVHPRICIYRCRIHRCRIYRVFLDDHRRPSDHNRPPNHHHLPGEGRFNHTRSHPDTGCGVSILPLVSVRLLLVCHPAFAIHRKVGREAWPSKGSHGRRCKTYACTLSFFPCPPMAKQRAMCGIAP